MVLDGPTIISVLKGLLSSSSKYALPQDPVKDVGIHRWTTTHKPTFVATVKPANVEDIQKTVRFAVDTNVPLLAVATGHGYTSSFERAQNVLEIDISGLQDIIIDTDTNTITIGGAVKGRAVYEPLYRAGKKMPVGTCSLTGIVGVALGGGLNRFQGLCGLMIDSLLSLKLVTANGTLVTASKTENSELFWGMRGAGSNFGIVVSATYRIYDLANEGMVMNADMVFPWTVREEIVKLIRDMKEAQAAGFSLALGVSWNEQAGCPILLVNTVAKSPASDFEPLIKHFLSLNPVMQSVDAIPWNEYPDKWAMGADAALGTFEQPRSIHSAHVRCTDVPTWSWFLNELVNMWEKHPETRASLAFIEDWATHAVKAVPDEETAFPLRDVESQVLFAYSTTNPSLSSMLNEFANEVRRRFQATSGYDKPRVYVSYGHGDESQETLYGARKLPTLRELKKKWDPKGVFSFNNPITV